MFSVSDIISYIEESAPETAALGWDNTGLQVGSTDRPVSSVLTAVDLSPEVIDEARKMGANLIVTHHPLIFRPLGKIDFSTVSGRMIRELIIGGISHYAVHTNLDMSISGTGWALCEKIGLNEIKPLGGEDSGEMKMVFTGNFNPPLSGTEITDHLKKVFNTAAIRFIGEPARAFSVAVIPGSGGSLLGKLPEKFDLIVTGEVSYHDALSALWREQVVALFGHHISEKPAMEKLAEGIAGRFSGLPVRTARNEQEPYRII